MNDDPQQQARQIIETAMAALKAIGMSHDDAAMLLVVQGVCRIEEDATILAAGSFINDAVLAVTTPDDGEALH